MVVPGSSPLKSFVVATVTRHANTARTTVSDPSANARKIENEALDFRSVADSADDVESIGLIQPKDRSVVDIVLTRSAHNQDALLLQAGTQVYQHPDERLVTEVLSIQDIRGAKNVKAPLEEASGKDVVLEDRQGRPLLQSWAQQSDSMAADPEAAHRVTFRSDRPLLEESSKQAGQYPSKCLGEDEQWRDANGSALAQRVWDGSSQKVKLQWMAGLVDKGVPKPTEGKEECLDAQVARCHPVFNSRPFQALHPLQRTQPGGDANVQDFQWPVRRKKHGDDLVDGVQAARIGRLVRTVLQSDGME